MKIRPTQTRVPTEQPKKTPLAAQTESVVTESKTEKTKTNDQPTPGSGRDLIDLRGDADNRLTNDAMSKLLQPGMPSTPADPRGEKPEQWDASSGLPSAPGEGKNDPSRAGARVTTMDDMMKSTTPHRPDVSDLFDPGDPQGARERARENPEQYSSIWDREGVSDSRRATETEKAKDADEKDDSTPASDATTVVDRSLDAANEAAKTGAGKTAGTFAQILWGLLTGPAVATETVQDKDAFMNGVKAIVNPTKKADEALKEDEELFKPKKGNSTPVPEGAGRDGALTEADIQRIRDRFESMFVNPDPSSGEPVRDVPADVERGNTKGNIDPGTGETGPTVGGDIVVDHDTPVDPPDVGGLGDAGPVSDDDVSGDDVVAPGAAVPGRWLRV